MPQLPLTVELSIMMHSLEEINTLTYSAGYVPRAIKRKLQKQKSCPLTKDLLQLLCIEDIIDSERMINNGSKDWLELVDHGDLTCINSLTLEFF